MGETWTYFSGSVASEVASSPHFTTLEFGSSGLWGKPRRVAMFKERANEGEAGTELCLPVDNEVLLIRFHLLIKSSND